MCEVSSTLRIPDKEDSEIIAKLAYRLCTSMYVGSETRGPELIQVETVTTQHGRQLSIYRFILIFIYLVYFHKRERT